MCDGATTHQKPFKGRGGFILFGARAKGLSAVIVAAAAAAVVVLVVVVVVVVSRDSARERTHHPIYLTTNAEPKPKRGPAGLLPTDASSRRFFHVLCAHYVPGRYMYPPWVLVRT